MKDGLYHQKIGLPAGACQPFVGVFSLLLLQHARQASANDRYGRIEIEDGDEVEVFESDIVELEVRGGQSVKAVVRLQYDERRDIVVVLNRPVAGEASVRTAWFNLKSDQHRTLRQELYSKP